jgi:hypothetical protein
VYELVLLAAVEFSCIKLRVLSLTSVRHLSTTVADNAAVLQKVLAELTILVRYAAVFCNYLCVTLNCVVIAVLV